MYIVSVSSFVYLIALIYVFHYQVQVDEDPTQYFEAIYVHPKDIKHRLIVIPHGGPHGVCNITYSPFWEFMLNAGFGLLMVNYRGSIGEFIRMD